VEWQRTVRKKNGEPWKQFLEWSVPPDVCRKLALKDGSECLISLRLADYCHKQCYVLRSGREFRVPIVVAESLRKLAATEPQSRIFFEIERSLESVEGEFARRLQAASKLPQRSGIVAYRSLRNFPRGFRCQRWSSCAIRASPRRYWHAPRDSVSRVTRRHPLPSHRRQPLSRSSS
jgi:hypothetical protein